jgi:AcrR family transcriptional regulator
MPQKVGRAKKALEPGAAVRKPKGRGHERHDEILAAAARMFVELGIENVSTRRIAQAVGLSQTTLYVYFPTKAAILEALCDQCFNKLVALFRREEAKTIDPVERLRRMMRTYVRFGVEHGDEYRLAFMVKRQHQHGSVNDLSAFLDPTVPREALPPGMQCFLMLQDRVAELARIGALRLEPHLDPRLVAQALWATGHGLVTLLITMPEFPWVGLDALIDGTLNIQFRGLLDPSEIHNR